MITMVLRESGSMAPRFNFAAWIATFACFALNMYFLPTSNWHHKEFCLNPFNKAEFESLQDSRHSGPQHCGVPERKASGRARRLS